MTTTRTRKVLLAGAVAAGVVIAVAVSLLPWNRRGVPEAAVAEGHRQATGPRPIQADRQFKILHVMSYHSPWLWTDSQFGGFKEAMNGLNVEYKVFQLDTKRRGSRAWIEQASRQARELIDRWKPDLVFAGDDNAQLYVTKHYVNTDIPFVFCTVNADADDYGFVGSKNVTGVLEREHFVQTVRLLRKMVPTVRRVAVISDPGQMWARAIRRMKRETDELRGMGVEVVSFDVIDTFQEYKKRVKDYEGKVDALGLLGVFEFKDDNGQNVPLEAVSKWMVEHSRLPDFTFWEDRVSKGSLCAVTVSGYAQGFEAGTIARGILAEGRSPASYPIRATMKGEPIVSLARARKLNIAPASSVLLTAKVFTSFAWDKDE